MTPSTKRLTTLLLALLLVSLQTFSQTLVLNDKKDTTICFTLPQCKYLLKQTYKVKECDTLRKICEVQRADCDSVVTQQALNIVDYKKVVENQKSIIVVKDISIARLTSDLNDQKRATKLQSVYKWCAIIGGGVLSGYLGFKYVTR